MKRLIILCFLCVCLVDFASAQIIDPSAVNPDSYSLDEHYRNLQNAYVEYDGCYYYDSYKTKGPAIVTGGCLGLGLSGAIILLADNSMSSSTRSTISTCSIISGIIGVVGLGAIYIKWSKQKRKTKYYKRVINEELEYIKSHDKDGSQTTLSFGAVGNGVGVSLNF